MIVINTVGEIEVLKRTILQNAKTVFNEIKRKIQTDSAGAFLVGLKFDKFGVDPLKGSKLNFIEQLNQMFSDLVVLEGACHLLKKFPEKALRLNVGATSGFDIESADGELVAECFAVTTTISNRKMEKDCQKLIEKAGTKIKYIIFYSHNDTDERIQRIVERYPEIEFVRVYGFDL